MILNILLERQYALELFRITHRTTVVTEIRDTLNDQIGQNGHDKHDRQLPRRHAIRPPMDNVRLHIDHKEVHRQQERINRQHLRPRKIPKVDHQKDHHVQTQVAEDEVHVLGVNILLEGILFVVQGRVDRRLGAFDLVEVLAQEDRELVVAVAVEYDLRLSGHGLCDLGEGFFDEEGGFDVEYGGDGG